MSRSSLQGTPWHSEYLKTNDETRRHKTRCIYYKKGNCEKRYIKCPGSAHCGAYRETVNGSNKVFVISNDLLQPKEKIEKINNKVTSDDFVKLFKSSGNKYKGTLTVKIENEQPRKYKTSEIPNDAILFDKGYNCGVGDRFKIDDISILVINNKLEKR